MLMPRWFNTAGPCRLDKHYMLPPLVRLPKVARLIDQENYFVIHAPRQIGKTTAFLALAAQLNATKKYVSAVLSVEIGVPFGNDIGVAEMAILGAWRDTLEFCLPPELQPPDWSEAPPGQRISHALQKWSQNCPLPLVIFNLRSTYQCSTLGRTTINNSIPDC
jgi:hypothetical protein